MNRSPRLPNHARTRHVAPGQMTLDAALTRAQRRYPEALRFVPAATGRPLAVLRGGAAPAPTPITAAERLERAA